MNENLGASLELNSNIFLNDTQECPTSPIQVLIKDEIHEDVPYEFGEDNLLSPKSDNNVVHSSILESQTSIEKHSTEVVPTIKRNVRSKKNKKTTKSVSRPEITHAKEVQSDLYCKVCDVSLRDKEHFEMHQSGHANNLRCVLCTTVLKNFKNYEKHVGRCKPFECKTCGKIIRFRPNYIKHLRIHNPAHNQRNTTDEGEESVTRKKIPKSERHKYKCKECDKEFTSWEYFKVHQKIHVENVNLKCNICDRTFSAIACLRGHQKVHTGERPFR